MVESILQNSSINNNLKVDKHLLSRALSKELGISESQAWLYITSGFTPNEEVMSVIDKQRTSITQSSPQQPRITDLFGDRIPSVEKAKLELEARRMEREDRKFEMEQERLKTERDIAMRKLELQEEEQKMQRNILMQQMQQSEHKTREWYERLLEERKYNEQRMDKLREQLWDNHPRDFLEWMEEFKKNQSKFMGMAFDSLEGSLGKGVVDELRKKANLELKEDGTLNKILNFAKPFLNTDIFNQANQKNAQQLASSGLPPYQNQQPNQTSQQQPQQEQYAEVNQRSRELVEDNTRILEYQNKMLREERAIMEQRLKSERRLLEQQAAKLGIQTNDTMSNETIFDIIEQQEAENEYRRTFRPTEYPQQQTIQTPDYIEELNRPAEISPETQDFINNTNTQQAMPDEELPANRLAVDNNSAELNPEQKTEQEIEVSNTLELEPKPQYEHEQEPEPELAQSEPEPEPNIDTSEQEQANTDAEIKNETAEEHDQEPTDNTTCSLRTRIRPFSVYLEPSKELILTMDGMGVTKVITTAALKLNPDKMVHLKVIDSLTKIEKTYNVYVVDGKVRFYRIRWDSTVARRIKKQNQQKQKQEVEKQNSAV